MNKQKPIVEPALICKHCHRQIHEVRIKGVSLICPHCKRPTDIL